MKTPIPSHYDPENARQLVTRAAAAYLSDASDQSDVSDPSDKTLVIESRTTDTRAVISELSTPNSPLSTDLVVSFRGTADLRNWLTDLDCQKVPLHWAPGKVHRGFQFALESVAEELDAALHPDDPRRVWVTGHSLGGALAMLFALRQELRRGLKVAGVYTFGQPRVGNYPFSVAYNAVLKARTFRVVHADDLVPRVPWLLGAFLHCGTEIFYTSYARATLRRSLPGCAAAQPYLVDAPWWVKAPSDVIGAWSEWRQGNHLALLSDHHISRYAGLFCAPSFSSVPSLP